MNGFRFYLFNALSGVILGVFNAWREPLAKEVALEFRVFTGF
ncbi:MAG: hypothetical protein V7K98_20770 [Nostoc sp.]